MTKMSPEGKIWTCEGKEIMSNVKARVGTIIFKHVSINHCINFPLLLLQITTHLV